MAILFRRCVRWGRRRQNEGHKATIGGAPRNDSNLAAPPATTLGTPAPPPAPPMKAPPPRERMIAPGRMGREARQPGQGGLFRRRGGDLIVVTPRGTAYHRPNYPHLDGHDAVLLRPSFVCTPTEAIPVPETRLNRMGSRGGAAGRRNSTHLTVCWSGPSIADCSLAGIVVRRLAVRTLSLWGAEETTTPKGTQTMQSLTGCGCSWVFVGFSAPC